LLSSSVKTVAETQTPEIISVSAVELEQLLTELRVQLAPATYRLVESLLRTLQWVMGLLEEKTVTLARLRRVLFGHKTEATEQLFPTESAADSGATTGAASTPKSKRKGHGRRGAAEYAGAQRMKVSHPKLRAGELCLKCSKGKLYLLTVPARLVRLVAQPIFQATIFELERLRCALCGALFTAPAPAEANQSKYDPSVGVMLGIMRYGAGLPMYRMDKWQRYFGVPLPASTQWELIEAASKVPAVVYQTLIDTAAQGRLLHNDDTTMRVQSLRRESSTTEQAARTGIFTTSIVSQVDDHQVALFFTGQKHAGENLDQLLKRRSADLQKPLQMCDALARNESKEFATILCNCLLHGRRNFVDVVENFPEPCRKVIESVREIYRVEAQAKKQNLSDAQRLVFHQEHSQPVMEQLHQWMTEQIEQKQVEPNSGLGQAIHYMLKHWEALTRFLSVPGAPLDNNICERALKMAILHRKNSLSYKTLHGAQVGDIFMSLIHTSQLNGVNPFDYLMALEKHGEQVRKEPTQWLPWNYRQAIAACDTG
jgi:transposase